MSEPRPARQRIRAPQEAGASLVVPPPSQALSLLRKNRSQLTSLAISFLPSAEDWRQRARRELILAAVSYTQQYREVANPHPTADQPLVMAGHQPQLFHPGVWFKNFLLAQLGMASQGTAVNLVVDNDTQREPAITVPTGSLSDPRVAQVAYDAPAAEMPYEERTILDRSIWNSFPQRVRETFGPLVKESSGTVDDLLITKLESELGSAAARTNLLGLACAQARHAFEGHLGLQTLELPLSVMCQQSSFRAFTLGLLRDLPRLHHVYNQALVDYRRENHLRSSSHPAPNLEHSLAQWEVPLWIWSKNSPRRQRAFAHWNGNELTLTDRQALSVTLPHADDPQNGAAIAAWSQAENAGIKLRPRAFLTTMFARLMLADVFIHGIGGAKYDEVTDRLIAELAGCPLPVYITATATLPLPFPIPTVTIDDLHRTRALERRFLFHPELFARDVSSHCEDSTWNSWQTEKHRWLSQAPPRGQGKVRQREIARLNALFCREQTGQREALKETAAKQAKLLAQREVLTNREYSFVLQPAEKISTQLLDLSAFNS